MIVILAAGPVFCGNMILATYIRQKGLSKLHVIARIPVYVSKGLVVILANCS